MAKFLLDTNIWIDFLNKREEAIQLVLELSKKDQIYSSILTVTELRAGWTDERAERFMPIFYSYSTILEISGKIAELAGKLLYDYKRTGISLATVDTIIASTVIVEKCRLITNNRKDFPMPEIKFYPDK